MSKTSEVRYYYTIEIEDCKRKNGKMSFSARVFYIFGLKFPFFSPKMLDRNEIVCYDDSNVAG